MKFTVLCLGLLLIAGAQATTVTGKINNVAWTFVSGKAEVQGSNLKITLWNESYTDPCTEWSGSVFDVRAIFPARVGDFPVDPNGWSQNVIVMGDNRIVGNPANNIFANVGSMNITALSASQVSGTLSAAMNSMHSSLAGDFTIPLCSSGDN